MIRIGSLFAGIGGLDLGLEVALSEACVPHELLFQVELDSFCRQVLAKHWPHVDRSVSDVTQAGSSNLPYVDLLCGGFPCTDVSSAGKGAGLAGKHSGLWYEYRRIIGELRPRVVFVENVASGKRRYLCEVRSDLHALGYRTRAFQIGAWEVGAPHRRERVFIVADVADPCGESVRNQPGWTGRSEGPDPARSRYACGEVLAHAERCGLGQDERDLREGEPNTGRSDDLADADLLGREGEWGGGLPDREPAFGYDTNGRSGSVGVALGDANLSGPQVGRVERGDARQEREAAQRAGLLGNAEPKRCERSRPDGSGESEESGGRWETIAERDGSPQRGLGRGVDGLPAGLDRTLPGRWPAGRGAAQYEWESPRTIQTTGTGRRPRLKALGNAVVPAQAAAVVRHAVVPLLRSLRN